MDGLVTIGAPKELVIEYIKENCDAIERDFERFVYYASKLKLSAEDSSFIAEALEAQGLTIFSEVFEKQHFSGLSN